MTRPSTDKRIDAFVERERAAGLVFRSLDAAPWIDALEARLPRRFPPSFRSLVSRYAFEVFELGPYRLFANKGDPHGDDELAVRMFSDPHLAPLLAQGYLQVGTSNFYDPLCFDTRRVRGGGEYPLVTVSHEPVLIHGDTTQCLEVAHSFLEMLSVD